MSTTSKTSEEPTPSPSTNRPASPAKPPRTRRHLKRRIQKIPPPAIAVKGLWAAATEADRERAKTRAQAILDWWLGRRDKAAICAELKLPPLRLWQLSQMALSGMMAGLLIQPRRRSRTEKGVLTMLTEARKPENDPKWQQRRIRQLEQELAAANRVIALQRDLRKVLENSETTPPGSTASRKGKRRRAGKSPAPPARGAKAGRSRAPKRAQADRISATPGPGASSERSDAANVGEGGGGPAAADRPSAS